MELEQSGMHCFFLTSLGKSHYFISSTKANRDKWYTSLKSETLVVLKDLTSIYHIGEVIGAGNFAKVRVGTNIITNETFAIKSVSKAKLGDNLNNLVRMELY